MSRQFPIAILVFASATASLIGCVSSEESGASNKARMPIRNLGPLDTTHRVVLQEARKDTIKKSLADSIKLASKKAVRVAPRFRSKQDTVHASVIMKSKSLTHSRVKIERPEHPVFTIQIGAFGRASNALRAQRRAKERFSDQPVFNNYVKSVKLYRVSVGRYEDRQDAFALRERIKKTFPQEYSQCWINFIP